jgi:hypothetical protein
MRLLALGTLLVAATASQAAAQVGFSSTPGAPDPGFAAQSQQMIVDFNGGLSAGVAFSGSYSILAGSVSGAAAPAGSSGFFAVPNVGGVSYGTAVIDFQGFLASQTLTSLSFYWGSIDSYNTLELLDEDLNVLGITGAANAFSIVGNDLYNPADGNQTSANTNRRVFLDLASTPTFRALRLTSTGRAFEIDDIAGTVVQASTVPEPATASMLMLGLGLLGVAGARRKHTARSTT